ncbi:MAG: DUF721 domain-containing protein [Candidatus Baltobacteraceae bacterium]
MSLRTLVSAIGSWTPAVELSEDPLLAILAAWPSIVGTDIAKNSRPLTVTRGALVVLTRSSAWSQQLGFLSERIISAIAERTPSAGVGRVTFRVGKIATKAAWAARREALPRGPVRKSRGQSASLAEAFERFRDDVQAAQDAKRTLGWKECPQCGAWLSGERAMLCAPCENARETSRSRQVSRVLFEAPWLGYAGVAKIVADLSSDEYEAIRKRTLLRWWDLLSRTRRAGKLSVRESERLFASSYVLLKSQLAPEQITPSTVRNLLGDELHDLLYEKGISHQQHG